MEMVLNQSALLQIPKISISYSSKMKPSQRPAIRSSKDGYDVLMQTWDMGKIEILEEFKVALLNRANKVLGIYEASSGGITGTVADIRLIFGVAVTAGACSIILSHSHPSGTLKPSKADELLTEKFKHAGTLLDIQVFDHIIVTSENYFSFADSGLL